MKKALIIACFYQNLPVARPQLVFEYLAQRYKTRLVTADFCHALKDYDNTNLENVIKVHVPRYSKNFSIRRIWSHIVFAYKIRKIIRTHKPDILYICIPPNLAALQSVNVGSKIGSKCIVDLIDMWPNYNSQTNGIKGKILKVWGSYRERAIGGSDAAILQCELYNEYLGVKNDPKIVVIPLAKRKEKSADVIERDIDSSVLSFAYLGAFSDSYDFTSLITIMKLLTKWKPHLEIIGRGDLKKEILRDLDDNRIDYTDNGMVFDEQLKEMILAKCHLGYNGFRKAAIVGQSYKSVDYLSYGLPLLNSLGADTWQVVEKYKVGLNFDSENITDIVSRIDNLNMNELNCMRKNARAVFEELYSWDSYCKKMDYVLRMLGEIE